MASNTANLNLYKKDPTLDGNDTFNIKTMLNDNWDKIDGAVAGKVDKGELASHLADNIKHLTSLEHTNVINHLTDIMPHDSGLNQYLSNKDANGIYTVVDYKRLDETLYMKSTLSGGTSPNYITCTWKFYDKTGTNLITTKIWDLNYDNDGIIISKVVK